MRFLSRDQIESGSFGKAYQLSFAHNVPYIDQGGFLGGNEKTLIDLGCVSDGFVERSEGQLVRQGALNLEECVWSGGAYSNLLVGTGANVIGLRFLARHLVTFDFPNRTMYLQQKRAMPLVDEDVESAMSFLKDLKQKNLLPGWSKDEIGETAFPEADPHSITFGMGKNGDSSCYHYTVARNAKDSPWKLQKAWKADENNNVIEEFSLP